MYFRLKRHVALRTSLHAAVKANDLAELKRLLVAGACASAAYPYDYTPLHALGLHGCAGIAKHCARALLRAGANIEVRSVPSNPPQHAVPCCFWPPQTTSDAVVGICIAFSHPSSKQGIITHSATPELLLLPILEAARFLAWRQCMCCCCTDDQQKPLNCDEEITLHNAPTQRQCTYEHRRCHRHWTGAASRLYSLQHGP